jgi:hypothetical protein
MWAIAFAIVTAAAMILGSTPYVDADSGHLIDTGA